MLYLLQKCWKNLANCLLILLANLILVKLLEIAAICPSMNHMSEENDANNYYLSNLILSQLTEKTVLTII